MVQVPEFDQVATVYSGKPGCACGCRGKYSYTSQAPLGFIGVGAVNDRVVRSHLKRIKDAGVQLEVSSPGILTTQIDQRVYTIYLMEKAQ